MPYIYYIDTRGRTNRGHGASRIVLKTLYPDHLGRSSLHFMDDLLASIWSKLILPFGINGIGVQEVAARERIVVFMRTWDCFLFFSFYSVCVVVAI